MKNIVVLSGSVREGRKSHFVARLLFKKFGENENVNTALLDLKEYQFPIMTESHADKWPEGMKAFSEQLAKSDGIVIISPEYKNGIPGALKNVLDYLNPQIFRHIPMGLVTVSSGTTGGINCLSQLRLVCLAMGGIVIPEKLCISKVHEAFDESGNLTDGLLDVESVRFTESFLWYVNRFSS